MTLQEDLNNLKGSGQGNAYKSLQFDKPTFLIFKVTIPGHLSLKTFAAPVNINKPLLAKYFVAK
jgi:hypothetical protein